MNFLCYRKKATDKENQSLQGNSFIEGRSLQNRISSKILDIIDENRVNGGEKVQSTKLSSFRHSCSTKSIDFKSNLETANNSTLSNIYKENEPKVNESKYIKKFQEILKNDNSLSKSQEFEVLRHSLSISKGISSRNQLEENYLEPILDLLLHKLKKETTNKKVLRTHSITSRVRSKMVDWMLEVLCTYKCRTETFYKAVTIMDQFLLQTTE